MKDEKEYRRPKYRDQVSGVNVLMADGQAWCLPKPLVRFVPSADDVMEPYIKLNGETPDRSYFDLYRKYEEASKNTDVMRAVVALAKALLLLHYDLTEDQLKEVIQLSYHAGDAEGHRIFTEVMSVVEGAGDSLPKR